MSLLARNRLLVSESATELQDGHVPLRQKVGMVRLIFWGQNCQQPHSDQKACDAAFEDSKKVDRLEFFYEAGYCRQLIGLGHGCTVVAPSRVPSRPADRIKTDRRDSQKPLRSSLV